MSFCGKCGKELNDGVKMCIRDSTCIVILHACFEFSKIGVDKLSFFVLH